MKIGSKISLSRILNKRFGAFNLEFGKFGGKKKLKRFPPFITVSRESGTGGKLVAQKVAKKLGFEFYDKKLVEIAAERSKVKKELLALHDERVRSGIDDFIAELLEPKFVTMSTYIKSTCQVILSLCKRGKVVVLGRGGNFIAPFKDGLHVRIVAPFLVRVGNTVHFEHLNVRQAKKLVKKNDLDRKNFIIKYFHKNPSNANYYDLVINTENVTLDQAAEIVIQAFKQKFGK
jgi:cytidylate kinase